MKMKEETEIAEENIKTKNKVFYIFVSILMLVSTIYLASAYTPVYDLCFDENGRGIECETYWKFNYEIHDNGKMLNLLGLFDGRIEEYA
ncbi:hypothetical protein LCGC14_2585290, partial [marine sediment metagenome]